MGVSVESWSEDLRERVERAFGAPDHWAVQHARANWRAARDGEFWSRCVVLLDDLAPVAVASAFHPSLHTRHEWASVEVEPSRRRQGWGTRAADELAAALPTGAGGLRAKVQVRSAGDAFAAARGFAPLQRTRQVVVAVPAHSAEVSAVESLAPTDPEAIRAWRDFYLNGHHWDPPSEQSEAYWQQMLADGSVAVLGYRSRQTGALAGFGQLFTDDEQTMFVGGAVQRNDPEGPTIARSLLAAAAAIQNDLLRIELDDWMSEMCSAVEHLAGHTIDEAMVVARSGDSVVLPVGG